MRNPDQIEPEQQVALQDWLRRRSMFLAWATLLTMAALYLYNLDGWLNNDDEGVFLYQAWRTSLGEIPYIDFYSSRLPLFTHTGSLLIRLLGPSPLGVRAVSVGLILLAGLFVFLTGRRVFCAPVGLVAMVVFLLYPAVHRSGRYHMPDNYMVFWETVGLYLFCKGYDQEDHGHGWMLMAGLAFGLSTLYKLFGLLPLAGCSLALGWRWITSRASRPRMLSLGLALGSPFLLLAGCVLGYHFLAVPTFLRNVIGVNTTTGLHASGPGTILRGARFLVAYFLGNGSLLVLALPAALRVMKPGKRGQVLAWQIPTALGFLLIPRELHDRHLLYLLPSLALLFAAALRPLLAWPRHAFLAASLIGALCFPWLVTDTLRVVRIDQDTQAVAAFIRSRTSPEDHVLCDYGELIFHAERPTTYWGAEISRAVALSGLVSGARLIEEIEAYDVRIVLVDSSPKTAHHLASLPDYVDLRQYLQQHFDLIWRFPRHDQLIEVYQRGGR
jgi:4-amino-4-deoxy-L-arabinose transferase-like glycosyltransferase